GMTSTLFSGNNAMFPDPNSVQHPAGGKTDISNRAYSNEAFNAWYWRSCVDMIRANFNPNGYFNKMNPDAAMYTTVDVTDLSYQTAPMCFSSMGVFEIVSQGEVVFT